MVPGTYNRMMLTAVLLCLAGPWTATPKADVWVYPHSSNPGGESYMRVWGDGTKATDENIPPADAFSYGYIAFDIASLPKGEITSASLTVWNAPNPALTADVVKASPLEVFGLKGEFSEEGFSFDGAKCGPTGSSLGTSTIAATGETGIKLVIDLKGEDHAFAKAVEAARSSGTLYLALASKISPAESRSNLFKIATREAPEAQRPVLSISVE